ncbi:MAG: acetyltransferase [Rikenellaceae bacterium]
MYLYGASGHAKVILDILKANNIQLTAFIDDNKDLESLSGVSVLHSANSTMSPMIISIGNNKVRQKIAELLDVNYISVVHPSGIVSNSVQIGMGTVVMQGAIIQVDTIIGEHAIVNSGASIDHDCNIGDFAHIAPHSTLCGNVDVGEGSWIGAGATVIQGVKIGKWATIGAGAVVIKDVPDYAVVAGVPAKVIKFKNIE